MGAKARILIVDDEPLNIDYLEQELEELHFVTFSAADGVEALEQVEAEAPDLILLDIMMPRMDGFAVLERLKAEKNWRDIPVVVISAMTDLASIAKGIEMGAEDYLPKPFDPVLLQARISSGLEKKRLRDLEREHLDALERELAIGRGIQEDFLPQEIPQPVGWEIAAHFAVAREVAGDFYDVFELPDNRIGIMVGDVCDKGVGSALYMALYRSLLRASVDFDRLIQEGHAKERTSGTRLLQAVQATNTYICRIHDAPRFVTLFFGALDPETGTLDYLSAGHDPPYILNGSEIKGELLPTGPAIGFFEDAEFAVERVILEAGDLLFIFTDGVTDVENAAGKMFETKRLREALTGSTAGPQALLAELAAALDDFMSDAPRYDDVTMLAVQKK